MGIPTGSTMTWKRETVDYDLKELFEEKRVDPEGKNARQVFQAAKGQEVEETRFTPAQHADELPPTRPTDLWCGSRALVHICTVLIWMSRALHLVSHSRELVVCFWKTCTVFEPSSRGSPFSFDFGFKCVASFVLMSLSAAPRLLRRH